MIAATGTSVPFALLVAYVALVGACIGSFMNVVIYRLPRRLSVANPPSSCPKCERRIAPYDNIPIVSWLVLRGRCRGCSNPIPWRYPAVELAVAIIAVVCLWQFGWTVKAIGFFALLTAMLAIAFIDWEHMIIPDALSLGFLVVGLVASPWLGPGFGSSLVGALAGGGVLFAVAVLWKAARGVDAMGGGDIKLMAAVGAFVGATQAMLVIFFGAMLGAVFGAVVLRRGGQARIAFGTFLSAATFVVVFFGERLVQWYLRTSGLTR